MKSFVGTKIGRRFLRAFILLFLPIVAAGTFGIHIAAEALRKQTRALLRAASDGAEAQVREFLVSLRKTTEARAASEEVRAGLKSGSPGVGDLSGALRELRWRTPEAREITCLNLEGGVVASSSPALIGKDESSAPEFQLGRQSFYWGNIVREPGTGVIRWRMSAPVKEAGSGRTSGVVLLGVDPGALNDLTTGKRVLAEGADTQSFRLGNSGETYVVNRNGYLLTESRFATNSILTLKVETAVVRAAVERDKESTTDYEDYRGVPVSGTAAIVKPLGWVLVTEIDFSQTFAPIRRLRNLLIGITIITLLIAASIAAAFTRSIVTPLHVASEADRALARGAEAEAIVPEEGLAKDEIGDFIRQRNARIRSLFEHERELLMEQKRRAEAAAALEGISYSMVHDMRAPLRTIATFGDLLAEEAGDRLATAEKGYLDRMKNAALRMDRLICDLLRYSSLLRAEVLISPVNTAELLRQVIEEHPFIRERRAQIEIQEKIPAVQGNAAVLAQCFSILLDNALRYTRPGIAPKVRVWAEAGKDYNRLLVEDNGTGMSDRFQKRLFGIFQRGTNAPEGTGIGLALVRVAVERMSGYVAVESEEGSGSRFWIQLKPVG
jgi:signal transduction histidine kinase